MKLPLPGSRFVLVISVCLLLGAGFDLLGLRGRYLLRAVEHSGIVEYVHWETTPPEAVGIRPSELAGVLRQLQQSDTDALLIVKNDRLIYEWYRDRYDQNSRLSLAAAAKPLVGAFLLALAAQQGVVTLDQPVSDFLPEWKNEARKATITFRQLASHTSGLEDVEFLGGNGRHKKRWKREYESQPWIRFNYARYIVPMQEDPGTRYVYSGAGYYVISYALTRAFERAGQPADLAQFYQDQLLDPLGIHPNALRLSYGQVHQIDGMMLYSIGSGTSLTARAVARIAQLVKNEGSFANRPILQRQLAREMVTPAEVLQGEERRTAAFPVTGLGWYLNSNGFFPWLPSDAIVGFGNGPQLVCIFPSLNLILVRTGGPLDGATRQLEKTSPVYFDPIVSLFKRRHELEVRSIRFSPPAGASSIMAQ